MAGSVDQQLAEARAAWPELDLETFRAYVAERVEGPFDGEAASRLHLGDLCLACGCVRGDERAARAFRKTFEPALAAAVARSAPEHLREEILAMVYEKLLVRDRTRPPALASYRGEGKLATWVQVVAARVARSRLRWEQRHGPGPGRDEVEELVERATSDDVLLDALKQRYRREFKHAFAVALGRLSARERNLLRYECFDRLSRDEIAGIYRVSRATLARWRASCRARLHAETLAAFGALLGLGDAELESAIDLIKSQLQVSLSRVLLADGSEPRV